MTGYDETIGYDSSTGYDGTVPIPSIPIMQSTGGNMLMIRETPILVHDSRQRAAILETLEDEW